MQDFQGNKLRLGDQVITVKKGGAAAFVAGEVVKLTDYGAKIMTNATTKDGVIWRRGEKLQRACHVIHLVERNPIREQELLNPQVVV